MSPLQGFIIALVLFVKAHPHLITYLINMPLLLAINIEFTHLLLDKSELELAARLSLKEK
ncbi:hypothetical protein [Shewanella pealeana]|uniref:hypothetical protein n=1 Tax=Shewanella pealeana TaxID=70864 RepID=UPI0003173B0F|nr:hypothetical protein [Shewanella pealeana]